MKSDILGFNPRTSGLDRVSGVDPGLQAAQHWVYAIVSILEEYLRRTGA
jgi:hypothetical protein